MRRQHAKSKSTIHSVLRPASAALLGALCSIFVALPNASAQDPNKVGALPYIIVIMDTSASVESTSKGENVFPERNGKAFNIGDPLHLLNPAGQLNIGPPQSAESFYGPCAIWEPRSCQEYQRPAHFAEDPYFGPDLSNTQWSDMQGRLNLIRENTSYRLIDENQPKHFTIKEILTGDMILAPQGTDNPDALNPADYGPGCWLVPRMAHSLLYPEMANYCTSGPFRVYKDSGEAIPHFQEIYNHQRKNGLLDNLSRTAIFAFAGLDSFVKEFEFNDPYITYPSSAYPVGRTQKREDYNDCPGGRKCENLGVTRIIGPSSLLGLSLSDLAAASEYTQQAVLNAGYMRRPNGNPTLQITGNDPRYPYRFQPSDRRFLNPLPLGRQPIARATPLAAAVYDANNFFGLSATDVYNPLHKSNDPYTSCRDRHVVLISDGSPSPERPSPNINVTLGSNALHPAFGYDPAFFPYDTTEQEISYLHQYRPPRGNAVKTHVVALLGDLAKVLTPPQREERRQRLRKLDTMAASGGTCASETLSPQWISKTQNPNECQRNGGPGANLGRACLDTSTRGDWGKFGRPDFRYTRNDGTSVPCKYPSLVLTKEDRDDVEAALAETLNNIIQNAGVTSRTRTVYSEDLQAVQQCNGINTRATGVNEFLSGVKIGGAPIWHGLLYRNTYACGCNPALTCAAGGSAPTFTDFSSQINQQVKKLGFEWKDNRRIYTSYLSPQLYDYSASALGTGSNFKELSNSEPDRFFNAWNLYQATSDQAATFRSPRPASDTYPGAKGTTQYELETTFLESLGLFGPPNNHATTTNIAKFLGLPSNANRARVDNIFNHLRGRTLEQENRTLGGIYNGNPVTLDPPALDIPIESYRAFKQKHAKRPPILFVPTMDGLLHAMYSGEGEVIKTTDTAGVIRHRGYRSATDPINNGSTGEKAVTPSSSQREAWAYLPFSLIPKIASSQSSNPYLLDGTPSVKDVRLCNQNSKYNQNETVCGKNHVLPADQWRTVLVQGLGLAGAGYFALDVTYQGGQTDPALPDSTFLPDPITLWEFFPTNERIQTRHLYNKGAGEELVGFPYNPCPGSKADHYSRSFMGNSISDPEIGTLLVKSQDGTANTQRPVAFFGGGEPDPAARPACLGSLGNISGKAAYIIDMQTGSLLRRFVSYIDENKHEKLFPDPITGSPALYNNFVGGVATRGFIGDSKGRLYKVDLSSSDPKDWKVYLFFDPAAQASWFGPTLITDPRTKKPVFGPANYKPAISKLNDQNLLVVYGLGEVGDRISPNTNQAVIALRDRLGLDPKSNEVPVKASNDPAKNDLIWNVLLTQNEKMTGAPFIFDNVTYYPTYKVSDATDLCDPGQPSINRVTDGTVHTTNFNQTTSKTIIRGLSLRINPCCGGGSAPPELVAQTGSSSLTQTKPGGGASGGGGAGGAGGGGGGGTAGSGGIPVGTSSQTGELSTFRQNIKNPTSQSIPLSWTRLIN